jgi:hypothetical protein
MASGTLTPGDAAAIAASWQSPAGHGAVLAQFACGMPTDTAELLEAIAYETRFTADDPGARAELDALRDWVRDDYAPDAMAAIREAIALGLDGESIAGIDLLLTRFPHLAP